MALPSLLPQLAALLPGIQQGTGEVAGIPTIQQPLNPLSALQAPPQPPSPPPVAPRVSPGIRTSGVLGLLQLLAQQQQARNDIPGALTLGQILRPR